MNFENKFSKILILSSISVIVVCLIISIYIGKKQDQRFLQDQTFFNSAVEQLQQGDYAQANNSISSLSNNYYDSERVNYIEALIAFNAGEVEKASKHIKRVLDINPYKVEDPMFMLQLAQILTGAGDLEDASIVLERCKSFEAPEDYPQYHDMVDQLQQAVEQSS